MILVVDASVAVEYLLRTQLGVLVARRLEGADLVAPELMDVEVMAVIREALLAKRVGEERAFDAIEDLAQWPLRRVAHKDLLCNAWRYRHNVSAYDSLYLVVASCFEAPLLTADGPLARAPTSGVLIENLRV